MNETYIPIRGRLTQDPELRYTPSGVAVANLQIACNARRFNKQTQQWEDEPAVFWRCAAWNEMAERVANTLQKGYAVVALGVANTHSWETKEGDKRSSIELRLEAIGPDLRWMEAKASKAERQASGSSSQWGAPSGRQGTDPWATMQPANDEPPF